MYRELQLLYSLRLEFIYVLFFIGYRSSSTQVDINDSVDQSRAFLSIM